MTPSPKRTHNLYFLRDKSKHFATGLIIILIIIVILIRLEIPIMIKSLSENGARLCRRPAAALGQLLNAPKMRDLLRLVEDDTAALRDFQTRSKNKIKIMKSKWIESAP